MKTFKEILDTYLNFFKEKNHAIIPNYSLVPEGDSSLLFVNSGMFPLVPYLLGQTHPLGNRLANFQRCVRTEDIEEVGNYRHHTFFNMLGNWSLGDYFKKEQIENVFELYVEGYGLDINKLFFTVFAGAEAYGAKIPGDEEAIECVKAGFKKYGIDAEVADPTPYGQKDFGPGKKYDLNNVKIFPYGIDGNWWTRGWSEGEPGGPDCEIFYLHEGVPQNEEVHGFEHPNTESGRFVEIGNSVFMQYIFKNNSLVEMDKKKVDFGGGFDRIVASVQNTPDNYQTDLFTDIIKKIEDMSGKKYGKELDHVYEQNGDAEQLEYRKHFRVIADHVRASTFLVVDGVKPDRKDQGYILRRLIRRAVRSGYALGIEKDFLAELSEVVVEVYKDVYPHLQSESGFS
jgi:alanyl-tRNA synthetase